jgi:uncharacterized membrane protein
MGDNAYFWMKALHEIVALWLAAGVFGSVVLRAYFKRTGSSDHALLSRLHTVFSVPGVILAGILGFALLGIRKFGFNLGWVQGSLALYLVLLVSILFIQLPALRKGAPSKLAGMLPHIDATLIVILVILMAVKPAF